MAKWIGKFALLLKRCKDAWMDLLPLSIMSAERRRNQYLAEVTQENGGRLRRNANVLDPDEQKTRDNG